MADNPYQTPHARTEVNASRRWRWLLPFAALCVLGLLDLAAVLTGFSLRVESGLSQRPELAEAQSLVEEAVARLRREQVAPLVPSVLLGLSYGGNGGGLGSDIVNFGGRMDFDAMAYWEMRNLGFGDAALRRETSSLVRQARWQQLRQLDQVAAEINEAHVQVQARAPQLAQARAGVTAGQDSYRRNLARIREGQGLPLEVLQSLQALDQAQRQYLRTIADYDRAQFRLLRALGWPEEL